MAENQQKPKLHQQETEITSEENSIDEDDLELSLGFRPIQSHLLQTSSIPQNAAFSPDFVSKRDVQALRRFEAKKKRDLKRKVKNSDVDGEGDRFLKAPRLNASFCASPSSWWSWNSTAVTCGGGFRPYKGQNGKIDVVKKNVDDRDQGESRQSISTGSSSGISDNHQTISALGGNTSSAEARSNSSQSHSQIPSPNTPTPTNSPLQPCTSQPDHLQLQPNNSTPNNNHQPPHLSPSSSNHLEAASKSPQSMTSLDKGSVLITQSSVPKEPKVEIGKPPRPNGQITQQKLTLSQMPCVSATGNGPNGKTITGFLYKYTKAEVSIVCVCHGSSFSPAGFVEHAGCVDVEHPLKHIRVVPFAL